MAGMLDYKIGGLTKHSSLALGNIETKLTCHIEKESEARAAASLVWPRTTASTMS